MTRAEIATRNEKGSWPDMLSATDQELIARHLDGSLEKPQRKQVRALLRSSREARGFYRALHRERAAIAKLPVHKAPARVLPAVMARVETNPFETIPSTTQPGRKPRRSLLHYAIAASVAAAVCAGAIWTMQATERRALVLAQAQALPLIDDAAEQPPEEPRVVVTRIPADDAPLDPSEEKAAVTELAPTPRAAVEPPRSVLGAPPLPPLKLETVLVKLPMIAAMKDLQQSDVKKRLTAELSRGSPARVDIFCSDPLKAAELLIAT